MRILIVFLVACGGSSDSGVDAPAGGHKRMFETKTSYTGDLKTQGGGSSGIDGGDKLCASAATAASLGGTWKAWLADSSTDAITRISDVGPWYQLDGTKTFESKAALAQPALADVVINELGQPNGNSGHWTGTTASAAKAPDNCTNWTSTTTQGEAGGVDSLDMWAGGYTDSCTTHNRIVCFEQ